MSAEIKPALTSEEWADGKARTHMPMALEPSFVSERGTLQLGDHLIETTDLPVLIALANAALPDDDPRKITRADVDFILGSLRAEGAQAEPHPKDPAHKSWEYGQKRHKHLLALGAKLAALLPPETQ